MGGGVNGEELKARCWAQGARRSPKPSQLLSMLAAQRQPVSCASSEPEPACADHHSRARNSDIAHSCSRPPNKFHPTPTNKSYWTVRINSDRRVGQRGAVPGEEP